MKGIFFLTWRYLKPKKNISSIVTWLSCLGPMLGVGVLLVVMSVMNGHPHEIQKKIMEVESHISMSRYDGKFFPDYLDLMDHIEKKYDFKCSPYTQMPIFIQQDKSIKSFLAKGILPEYDQEASKLKTYIIDGLDENGKYQLDPKGALISSRLSAMLGVTIGDKIIVHSPQKYGKLLLQKEEGKVDDVYLNMALELTVSGIFRTGYVDIDKNLMFIHLDSANELLEQDWGASLGIDLSIPDPVKAEEVTKELARDPYFFNTKAQFYPWQYKKKQFFDIVKKEKTMMTLVLFFIVGGAAVGVAACLFSLVLQKTREIGVLKAIGATPVQILWVFLIQGLVLGTLGSTLGLAGGLFTLHNREWVVEQLGNWDRDFYMLDRVPMLILSSDVHLIFWGAIIICAIASLFPALVAVCVNPVKALQSNE